ncbi:MAG: hypothetical protein WC551_00625 [Patescibacteria group bacterium]
MGKRNDSDKLTALREYVKSHCDGDKKILGQMFALQEELTDKTGQFVLLLDHETSGPARTPMQRGPLCGDVLDVEPPRETSTTKFSLSVLKGDTLRLGANESVGLNTGKVATGQLPDGKIEVSKDPLAFSESQHWIIFGLDGGKREYDDGYVYRCHVVEILVGTHQIIRRFSSRSDGPYSSDARLYLSYIVGLAWALDHELGGDMAFFALRRNLKKDINDHLLFSEKFAVAGNDVRPEMAKRATADMRAAVHLATILGYGDDPYVADIKRRYLDKT